ncbi:MAG: tetratricopeptide repeat protein, partial [Thermoguttaceae bacterium]|nr:tetratricopeptide repeat protein [Thermoguttaceae bacterium]
MTGTKGKSRLAAAALYGAAWGCCAVIILTGCRLMPFAAKRDVSEKLELNRQGIAAFERQEYDTAEKKFIEAAERDKADLTSRRYYAETLWARGAKSDAVQLLAELSKTEGPLDDSLAINQSLAEKLLEEKQPVSALNYAERVVQSSPQSSRGWALRAEVYRQLGKNEEAIGDYHHALHFDPDNREFLRSLAELESQAGRCE